jgi:hypothetical protein
MFVDWTRDRLKQETRMRKFPVKTMLASCLIGLGAMAVSAQVVPNGQGRGGLDRDPVTGYLCVTPSCDVVRMSEARCICTKDNPLRTPAEQAQTDLFKARSGQMDRLSGQAALRPLS